MLLNTSSEVIISIKEHCELQSQVMGNVFEYNLVQNSICLN